MKNLTPENLRCIPASCPAVYELEDGRLLVVGKVPGNQDMGDARVGLGELAIVIDRALLANVK